ncbi:MAG: hypothetical protein RLY21_1414 [Planctomycetota bacterium]|jgi:hypothetical protein
MSRTPFTRLLAAGAVLLASGCDRTHPQQPAATATPAESTPSIASPTQAPPVELSADARSGTSADGTYTVKWEVVGGAIPDAEPFAIAFAVTRTDGKPVAADAEVFVDAEMPHHGHGMNFVPTVKRQGGDTFLGEGLLFHMPGRWVLAIDVGEDGIRERTQWFVDVE